MLVVWQQRLSLPPYTPLLFVVMQQMIAEGQSGQMGSDMEVLLKQRPVMCSWILLCGKQCTYWHSLLLFWMLIETKQWMWAQLEYCDSGSSSLVQIVMSAACRLPFTAGENAQLVNHHKIWLIWQNSTSLFVSTTEIGIILKLWTEMVLLVLF